jgi:hypothetical protein
MNHIFFSLRGKVLESLLRRAQEEGYTHSGEMFDAHNCASLFQQFYETITFTTETTNLPTPIHYTFNAKALPLSLHSLLETLFLLTRFLPTSMYLFCRLIHFYSTVIHFAVQCSFRMMLHQIISQGYLEGKNLIGC